MVSYVEFFECSFSGAVFIRAYTLASKLRKRRIVADDLMKCVIPTSKI